MILPEETLAVSVSGVSYPSDFCLFRVPARSVRNLTCKVGSIFYGKQHGLRVQVRPGRGTLAVHEEMTVRTDGCPHVTGTCRLSWQAERDYCPLRSQAFNALPAAPQSNPSPPPSPPGPHPRRT